MWLVKHILWSTALQLIEGNTNLGKVEIKDQRSKINALTCSQEIRGVFIAIPCQNLPGIPPFESKWMRMSNDNPNTGKHLSSSLTILYFSHCFASLLSEAHPGCSSISLLLFFPFPNRENKINFAHRRAKKEWIRQFAIGKGVPIYQQNLWSIQFLFMRKNWMSTEVFLQLLDRVTFCSKMYLFESIN